MCKPVCTLLVLLLSQCVSPVDVDFFQERPLSPIPEEYRVWYQETEACVDSLGLPNLRDFHQAQWFVADSIVHADGRHSSAATVLPGDHIVVTPASRLTRYHIRHEAAHHITQIGDPIHTDGGFGALCDGWPQR